tara:strand:+ start:753 stop:1127 length:375 start_codon:yes stop_codon:yes gene_type:complete
MKTIEITVYENFEYHRSDETLTREFLDENLEKIGRKWELKLKDQDPKLSKVIKIITGFTLGSFLPYIEEMENEIETDYYLIEIVNNKEKLISDIKALQFKLEELQEEIDEINMDIDEKTAELEK